MNDVIIEPVRLKIGEETFEINYSLNILAAIQNRYGEVSALSEKMQKYEEIRWLVTQFVNDSINEDKKPYTEKWVGKRINFKNLQYVVEQINETISNSIISDENEDIENPNTESQ